VGLVTAQTAQQPQTPSVNPSVPATQSPASPGTATPSTTGGIAGSASSSSGQVPKAQIPETQIPEAQAPGNSISAVADSDLESQIQTALSKEPTLSGDSAHVTVSGDTVELAGTVGTSKEKVTATRIVQSYAGSKKLVNRLTIARRGEQNVPHAGVPDPSDSKLPPAAASPGNNALPSQGNSSPTSRPPL
jgi:hypothetical protein